MQPREQDILEKATAAFHEATNLDVEIEQFGVRGDMAGRADAVIKIPLQGIDPVFWAEVKPTVNNTTIARIGHEFAQNPEKWVLVTRNAQARLARTMKEIGVQFIDTAGNAYINRPPLLIFIQGNRLAEERFEPREKEMFGRAGLRVLFALLCKHELWNVNYREITRAARVALGTVAGVMKDLTLQGHLVELKNKQRRLVQRKQLLDKWTQAYAEKIRPKRVIGLYRGPGPDFWRQADLTQFQALWGGETAAYQMTRYLKPEITTIYARRPINDLVLKLKLRKDNDGDVEIREQFWAFDTIEANQKLVPPLLVYADLIATGDARNIETAKRIYGDYLERHFRED